LDTKNDRRAGIARTACILAISLQALAACRETGISDPRIAPTTTVKAARADTATAAAPDADTGTSTIEIERFVARFASGYQPVYPEMSRRLQEQGTVELLLSILDDGTVADLVVARSSGHRRLDESALTAARTWRFNPRTGGGDAEQIRYRVVFQLVD